MPINLKYLAPFEPGGYYHVYNRVHSNKKLFIEERNCAFFLNQAQKFLSGYLEFYSYCLLPNHFHFLVSVKPQNHSDHLNKQISNQFRSFFISYTNALNKEYGSRGGLFLTPFRRVFVNSDEYLSSAIRYIHRNPIHHGICKDISEYKASSYLNILKGTSSIVNRTEVLKWFGNADEFARFHTIEEDSIKKFPYY